MINLEFTPQQIEELKNYYNSELEKIKNRAEEINGIIAKLNKQTKPETVKTDIQQNTAPTRKSNLIINTVKTKNRSWVRIILTILKQNGTPLDKEKIYEYAAQIRGIKLSNGNKRSIEQTIHILRTQGKIESIKQEGKKEKLYRIATIINNPKIQKQQLKEKPKKNKTKKPANKTEIKKTIIKQKNTPPRNYTYNWPVFITNLLEKNQKVMRVKEIVEKAKEQFKVSEIAKAKFRGSISSAISDLAKKTKTLKISSTNESGIRFYALSSWFENGQLKTKYLK